MVTTTVYLIRHAEAMGNINGTFQGLSDCEISPNGKRQLELLRERFKEIEYDAIFSSPLKRAVKTAEAVNFHRGLEIHTDKGLVEINGGVFEGQKWTDLPKLFPEAYDLWENNFSKFYVEGGESMESVFNRITLSITQLAARNRGKTIAVVSHGCAIRNFLCYANGKPLSKIDEVEWAENTAVSKIEFDGNLKPSVIFQNDASHLTEGEMTISKQSWFKKELLSAK